MPIKRLGGSTIKYKIFGMVLGVASKK
jgi:hypothetical protein